MLLFQFCQSNADVVTGCFAVLGIVYKFCHGIVISKLYMEQSALTLSTAGLVTLLHHQLHYSGWQIGVREKGV